MSVAVITLAIDVSHCQHYASRMARWEPDARGRLQQAALELYGERGFEQTTVAEIARRAGLTERTFFRYFPDKREVLFDRSKTLEEAFTSAAAAAAPPAPAPDASELDAVAAGLRAAATLLETERGRDRARARARIVAANAELQEREMVKMASLAGALAETLEGRGAAEPTAGLTAEIGIAIFRVAFARWVADDNRRDLTELVGDALDELHALSAVRRASPASG
jgi:AcrR family transcriptional regulator